jgi:transcriptional regulator with PAS, ATPase and Fis domain
MRVVSPPPLSSTPGSTGHGVAIVAVSAAMLELLDLTRRAAASHAKVLITGESGVGKDLLAHCLHVHSPRAPGPFVAVNCAGLTETLLESELFGHVRGSFTGAYRDKPGKLQLADHGTLFLDEIGEMSLRMQALLLRFLETGEIQPVGSDGVARADVRVVAATNRDLAQRVASGDFREDLLYRLQVIHLHVPPLRERKEDISPLVEHCLARSGHHKLFTTAAFEALQRHRWPGNVRELHNVVEQAVWLAPGDVVDVDHLPAAVQPGPAVRPARERRRQVADDLCAALIGGDYFFWEHVYPLFLSRDLTRHDLRELVRRGLAVTHGNYRALLDLFHIPQADYKRFLNFLAAHDCSVDYREFRGGASAPSEPPAVLPPLASLARPAVKPD